MSNKKAKGKRAKTRRKFKRNVRAKTTINEIIKPINLNDTVQININSSQHAGLPHHRMMGLSGKVIGFQGKCPMVQIKHGNKIKTIITNPTHLKILAQISKGEKK